MEALLFGDKVMGSKTLPPPLEKKNLLEAKLAKLKFVDGNKLKLMVYLANTMNKKLSIPWKDALTVKQLGKRIRYVTMRDRLKAGWRLSGGFEIVDIGHGYFIVKFDLEEDRLKVIDRRPCMIFYHYLEVQPWTLKFASPLA